MGAYRASAFRRRAARRSAEKRAFAGGVGRPRNVRTTAIHDAGGPGFARAKPRSAQNRNRGTAERLRARRIKAGVEHLVERLMGE